MRTGHLIAAVLVGGACVTGATAPQAEAFNPLKPVCAVGGLISGLVGKACTAVQHGGSIVSAGKKLATGHLGSAVKTIVGGGGSSIGSKATFALGLAAVVSWVLGGARYALKETATVIGHTTAPQLRSTWFSATYWRVAGIAAVLTLPFLFAAAIQALVQSDLALLVRAALGYLPLAMLGVGIAAPLTMLLLAATDQLSAAVSSAAGHASAQFLGRASAGIGVLTLVSRSPFLVFFAGLLTVGAAIVLWFELLLRAAAVYVIVLMLPLAFAALVWPARRIWAIRAVEVLVALILSKFLIVAVLSLGGAALSQSFLTSVSGMLAGFVLLVMGALTPWALLRLLPLGDLAAGAAGALRADASGGASRLLETSDGGGRSAHEWAQRTAEMRRDAEDLPSEPAVDAVSRPPHNGPAEADTLIGAATPPAGDLGESRPAPGPGDHPARAEHSEGPTDPERQPPRERSPGLGPIWQMEDFSWPVTALGLEDGWPPTPIEDQVGRPAETTGDHRDQTSDPVPSPHEDHDPRPSPQPSEGGSL